MSAFAGIDIAAKSFDVVIRLNGKNRAVERFEQTPEGHDKAVRKLATLSPERVVMEATGIYFLDLALRLHEAGLKVSVINPKSFHRFAELKLNGTKTDAIDSALLAEYGERMEPRLWMPPAADHLTLRDIGRQINRLIHARTQSKNRLHALRASQGTPALLVEDEQEGVEWLDCRINRLSQAAKELILQSQTLEEPWHNMMAAKGIGEASAIAILAELAVLPQQMKSPQVSRHAGLDVRLTQSGTSVNKPGRLHKAGNAYLRSALFMPAMCAVRYQPETKAFYEALLARGKKKRQAQCAVMRKYLTGLWACIRTGTPFDAKLLFSDQHQKTA